MIRIIRRKTDGSGRLIEPSANWFLESNRKRVGLETIYNTGGRGFTYDDHYRHIEVKNALEEVFNFKCCYCERRLIDGDFDVEHYRPKGRPKECAPNTHFGYYWLAYEWSNLYPSCEKCNQPRKDRGGRSRQGTGRTSGKHHSFKLATPTNRATNHTSNLNLEDPLLLDPCADRPENHISFDVNGKVLSISACPRGQETIYTIGLDRSSLNQFRKEQIQRGIEHLRIGFQELTNGNRPAFLREIQLFMLLTNEKAEFSAAVKSIVRDPIGFGLKAEFESFPLEFQNIINRF